MDFITTLATALHQFSEAFLVSLIAHMAFAFFVIGMLYLLLIFPFLGDKKREDIKDLVKMGIAWARVARGMK